VKTLRGGILIAGAALVVVSSALACSSSSPSENDTSGKADGNGGAGTTPADGNGGAGTTPADGNGGAGMTPDDGEGGSGTGTPTEAVGSLSCLQIVDCSTECAETDDPCFDACWTAGSDDGQATLNAFLECVVAEACEDATCYETQCADSLSGCVNSSTPDPGGRPLEGTEPPPGDVPADLVGKWSRTAWGDTHTITLNADGTGSYFFGVANDSAYCAVRLTNTYTGTAVVSADMIAIHATDVVHFQKTCEDPVPDVTNGDPTVKEFTWSRQDAETILVQEIMVPPCNPAQTQCEYSLKKE